MSRRLPRLRRKLSSTGDLLAGQARKAADPELALDGGPAVHRSAAA